MDRSKLDLTSTVDLIKELQARFTDRVPRHKVDIEDVYKMQGQQQVIDYIIGSLQAIEDRSSKMQMIRDHQRRGI